MNRKPRWALLVCLGLLVSATPAQDMYADDEDSAPEKAKVPDAGFWPTQRLMEFWMHRVADDMAVRYEFDEDQLYLTREALKEHIPRFLNENRAEIQTLVNQFLEAQFADEAPEVEYVADWAQRVLPLMHKFEDVVDGLTGDMREYLTEDQVIIMEGEHAAFRTGMGLVTNKVAVWSDGGYDPEFEWPRGARHQPGRSHQEEIEAQQEMDAARQEAIARAREGQTANPARGSGKTRKDPWTRYVDEFVQRYHFNDEQKEKAYRVLESQMRKRDNYLERKLPEMDRIEKELKEAKTDAEREEAQAGLEKLNEPVDRLFQQLKDRLQQLPTRDQRKKAAQERRERQPAEPDKKPASKPTRPKPNNQPTP
ncbi:MAG TPA: hypothetical protein VM487_09205 [Phycisphaerae bacterium]|nr:hypothetical protein [Phycisphaerae bacterium]